MRVGARQVHVVDGEPASGDMLALYWHRRRHVHCAGMGVPLGEAVILSTGTPIRRPYPRNGHAVGDAAM